MNATGLEVVIQQPLPRFLVFLGSCISFSIVDLGGVFEADVMEHVVGDVFGAIRETKWETVGKFEFHFCVLVFEELLGC